MPISRNDPCPCGSGRKYKNCCMRQDRVKASRSLSVSEAEAYLLNALYTYAQSDRFRFESGEAFALYWGGRYDVSGIGDFADDMRRTIEWFVHDYATRDEDRTVLQLFIAEKAGPYPDALKEMLAAWADSITGMFRLLSVGAHGRLELYDCLRETTLQVQSDLLAHAARPGNLLIGRLFEIEGLQRLSANTVILPGDYEPGMVEFVKNAYAIYRDTHPRADWDAFLRANGHIFQAFMLSPKGEALRPMIGAGTPYHDPAVLRDRLREHTAQRQRQQQRERLEAERKQAPEHRTRTGIILPSTAEGVDATDQQPPKPKILIAGRDE